MAESTKEAILDAAEEYFAELGFEKTSLRKITQGAGANLAAVNYHFGSKSELFAAVLERQFNPINKARKEGLENYLSSLKTGEKPDPKKLLDLFVRAPVLHFHSFGEKGSTLCKILGRSLFEPNEVVQKAKEKTFREVFQGFHRAFQMAFPDQSPQHVSWKMSLVIGMLHFQFNHFSQGNHAPWSQKLEPEEFIGRIVSFAEPGFFADFPST